jgi:hypothetical protein
MNSPFCCKIFLFFLLALTPFAGCYSDVFEDELPVHEGEAGDDLTPPSNSSSNLSPQELADTFTGLYELQLSEKSVTVITPATSLNFSDETADDFARELELSIAENTTLLSRIMSDSIDDEYFDPEYQGNLFLLPVFGDETGNESSADLDFSESSITRDSLIAFYELEDETEIANRICTVNTTNSLVLNTDFEIKSERRQFFPQASTYPDDTTEPSRLRYFVAEVDWSMQQRFSGVFSECNRITEIEYHAVWQANRLEQDVCSINENDYPEIELSLLTETCEEYPDPITQD